MLSVKSKHGFTLVELMIVVVVVAILATVAIPAYQSSTAKARRADGQSALLAFSQAMERYGTANNTFLGAAAAGANTGAPAIFPTQAPIDGGTKYYNLTIEAATQTTYTLRATPINGQAGDGNLEIDNTGAKRWNGNTGWN